MCDDVMEVGWSFLWNITDETPTNCERFLEAQGLSLFEQCFDAFRNERELVRYYTLFITFFVCQLMM